MSLPKIKDFFPCNNCGVVTHINKLDAKPQSLAGIPATITGLSLADDRGEDFTVLECRDCYGPAYLEGP